MRFSSIACLLFSLLIPLALASEAAESVAAVEQSLVESTNEFRKSQGLGPLAGDPLLAKVARDHSLEMAKLNYFDHESPTPGRRYPWDRVNLAGVDSNEFGENIYLAEGYPLSQSPSQAMDSWIKSKVHRNNMLSPKFSRFGIGIATIGSQVYVTQLFSAELGPKSSVVAPMDWLAGAGLLPLSR